MTTLERCWLAYCACVVLALLAGGGGEAGYRPWLAIGVHCCVAAAQWLPVLAARRSGRAARIVRGTLACVLLPVVFSALAWLLPGVQPQPFECCCYQVDFWLFGTEATAALRAVLAPPLVLALQLVYAAFYFVPIAAAALVLRARGPSAFDRALTGLVGSFLCSYLGYLWFPTLAPRVVLPQEFVPGSLFASALGRLIDAGEANPRDCFPSGHTMLAITSVLLVRRWAQRWYWPLLTVVVPLVLSTMLLRYHWPIDVLVGALLAWPVLRACDWLLDRDGMPPA